MIAQTAHACFLFAQEHPIETKLWMEESNYICCLVIDDEYKLHNLIEKAMLKNILVSIFKEPDICDTVTAIVLEPGPLTKKLCSGLRLTFND